MTRRRFLGNRLDRCDKSKQIRRTENGDAAFPFSAELAWSFRSWRYFWRCATGTMAQNVCRNDQRDQAKAPQAGILGKIRSLHQN